MTTIVTDDTLLTFVYLLITRIVFYRAWS